MDARIYPLDDTRLQHSIRTRTERPSPTPLVSDGLALILAATSFWVEYAVALASSHHQLLLLASSPESRPLKTRASQ